MGKFKEQSTDWSEHPKKRTEQITVKAEYTDELEYTIPIPSDKSCFEIEHVYVKHGTAYVYFKDGSYISSDDHVWHQPDYGDEPNTTDWRVYSHVIEE
tara:strand:+ start:251 stop:544 length:294 start_codon:yes stop_codon:yes gene_type:complete